MNNLAKYEKDEEIEENNKDLQQCKIIKNI
jgi:hypothetical protein